MARWIAGVLLIMYGFAKINGAQFLVLDSERARPMGEVSGFWLTWYYFGWSTWYKVFLALAEIVGGTLLLWPRTALAGGLILLPVMINVVTIDIVYGVELDATIAACLIFLCVGFILWPHAARLRTAVFEAPSSPEHMPRVTRVIVVLVVLASAFGINWWGRNVNIRQPTILDGIWRVVADSGADTSRTHWQQAFFELNRAHMLILRAPGTRDAEHDFEVDSTGRVRIWERWLEKGEQIGEGRVDPQGRLDLTFAPGAGGQRLTLERAPLRPSRVGGN